MTEEEFMLTALLQCTRDQIYLKKDQLTPEQSSQLIKMKERRALGEPLQYVVGLAPFMDFELSVTPAVLIPRPETEILVEQLIRRIQINKGNNGVAASKRGVSILDVGTGSGAIAIALKRVFPKAHVVAWDVSQAALDVAEGNAARLSVDIDFYQKDLFTTHLAHPVDVVVSNPPYIPTGNMSALPKDVQQEPFMALDGGKDGLDYYRYLIPEAKQWLNPGGLLALEMGDDQADSVGGLLKMEGYQNIEFIEDYVRTRRHVFATIRH